MFAGFVYIIWNIIQGTDEDYLEAFIAFAMCLIESMFWAYTFWNFMRGTFGIPLVRQAFAFYVYALLIILVIIMIWMMIIMKGGLVGGRRWNLNKFEQTMQQFMVLIIPCISE